jgi:hypothetical protein
MDREYNSDDNNIKTKKKCVVSKDKARQFLATAIFHSNLLSKLIEVMRPNFKEAVLFCRHLTFRDKQ